MDKPSPALPFFPSATPVSAVYPGREVEDIRPVIHERLSTLSLTPPSVPSIAPEHLPQTSVPQYTVGEKDDGHAVRARLKGQTSPPRTAVEKTAAVKAQILRYYKDPELQMEALSAVISDFYSSSECPAELTLVYAEVNHVMKNGIVPKDRLLENTRNRSFIRLLAAMAGMQRIRENFLGAPSLNGETHTIDPDEILKYAQCACTAISSKYLLLDLEITQSNMFRSISVIRSIDEIGRNLIKKISAGMSIADVKAELSKVPVTVLAVSYPSKYFSPVILTHSQAFFSPQEFIFALSRRLYLCGVGKSHRGVHGGDLHDPLEILVHDIEHTSGLLRGEGENETQRAYREMLGKPYIPVSTDAALIHHLADTFYRTIDGLNVSDTEKRKLFLMTFFLLHENDNYGLDRQALELKTPKASFDYLFAIYHNTLKSNLGNGMSSVEYCLYTLEYQRACGSSERALQRKEQQIKELQDSKINRRKFHVGTHFAYDFVDSVLHLKTKKEQESLLEKLYTGCPADNIPSLQEKIIALREKHRLSAEAKPTASYCDELSRWKIDYYNAIFAEEMIKEQMQEMKNTLYPLLVDLPPLDIARYEDHCRTGEEFA